MAPLALSQAISTSVQAGWVRVAEQDARLLPVIADGLPLALVFEEEVHAVHELVEVILHAENEVGELVSAHG